MRPYCELGNLVLTANGARRNGRYEVGKYLADTGHPAVDPYYVSGFELHGPPNESGSIWTIGRFRGQKRRTPLLIGHATDFSEKMIVPEYFVDELKRRAKKNACRWVASSKGYLWLNEWHRFSDPISILMSAMHRPDSEFHPNKPDPEYWPPWEPGDNLVVVPTTRLRVLPMTGS